MTGDVGSEPEDHKVTGLEEAVATFVEAGLPFPPLPEVFVDRLRFLDHGLFGTREPFISPFDVGLYVDEFLAGEVDDYVILGLAGYGTNSWAVHYLLVQGALGVFLQVPWGGAYTDDAKARSHLAAVFGEVEILARTAQEAEKASTLAPHERVAIVDALREGAAWCRVSGDLAQLVWRKGRNPAVGASTALAR